ncbi:MAG: MFS transporter [Bacteroidales bacterium]|jgi:UMF1 family MFS transporter|nr:MFS transporter [Bacteroidales bacterium]
MEKNNKRTINAWASYDWSNSVYNLIITTAIFPIYYSAATKDAFGGEIVQFFGLTVKNTVLYTYAISFSFLIIVFLSPVLSGIADYAGIKKRFMKGFTYIGATACIGLYFFTGENIEYGIACSVIASIGFAGSLVFYNAFLPEVATTDRMDHVSAKGFAMGYIGSVILLIVNLAIILNPELFGFTGKTNATKFGFLLVGLWWLGFSQIAFYYLKDLPTGNRITSKVLNKGIIELKKVFFTLSQKLVMKRFLLAFFIFSMGVHTVMLLAPLFAESEIGFGASEMILLVIILQILAVAGAYFFAFLSRIKGNKFAIGSILVIWAVICIISYVLHEKISFYIMGGIIGIVMGAIQSLSRSTYSKLIPTNTLDTASFFSFYDITEKLAIVIGTFAYAYIEQVTGNMRYSMVSMAIFFIVGFIILQTVNFAKRSIN